MTTHVLTLTRGEWYKLRRRRIPWILLGIIAVITLGVFWIGYVSYHHGADSVAAAEAGAAALESSEGVSISVGLGGGGAGAGGFTLPFSIERIAGQLPERGRGNRWPCLRANRWSSGYRSRTT